MMKIVGMDLGTTNSLCAAFDEKNGPLLIPNALGGVLTPSVVGLLEDGRMLTGRAAQEMSVSRPRFSAARFKRTMGLDTPYTLGEQQFTAPELSSLILRSLAQDARAHLGIEDIEAVVTVPAYFNDNQRTATVLAGELAGLKVRRIINEPTAAALTYGYHERDADKKILVFDLGGGTFDVTVMEIFEGSLEIIATSGESNLGGEDFTDAVVQAVIAEIGASITPEANPLRYARLHKECDTAKLLLADTDSAQVRIPDADGNLDGAPTVALSRERFAQIVAPLMKRLEHPLTRAVRDAKCAYDDIEDVILVGGATRMPLIRAFLRDRFGKEPRCEHNPDEVVALGAAVQAALIEDNKAVEEMVLTDVCPFTLGVEISKPMGGGHKDGFFLPILHRNTCIPVSREEAVSTVHENQEAVVVKVYQGESRRTEENLLLGEMEVGGIPPGPDGQTVFIRFTYDLNGILEVEAVVEKTGASHTTVLTHHVKGLNPIQVERAVARMKDIKFYPRDDAHNQHLLHYAERVVAELNPKQRKLLEIALDFFQRTLYENDPARFTQGKAALMDKLDELGFGYQGPEA